MRRFGTIDGPVDLVRQTFVDVSGWPSWMPYVSSAKVVQSDAGRQKIELTRRYRGRTYAETMLLDAGGEAVRQLQLTGYFRKWDALWKFLPAPSGQGTTVLCELDVEVGGVLGMFATAGLVNRELDPMFRELLRNLERRVRSRLPAPPQPLPDAAGDLGALLRLYQTPAGLELWFEGKKYLLTPEP